MRSVLSLLVLVFAVSAFGQEPWTRDQPGLFETASPGVPSPFGWPLAPNADGVWTNVQIGDAEQPLALSTLFNNGLALGEAGALHSYRGEGQARQIGPYLNIHLSGVVSLGAPLAPARHDIDGGQPGQPAMGLGISQFKDRALEAMDDAPELLAPRWSEAQDYLVDPDTLEVSKPCGMDNTGHQVYVWSNKWDPARLVERPMFVITWNRLLPRDADCGTAPNTFQAVIIEEAERAPDPAKGTANGGRNLATLQYRYGLCSWSAPEVDPENLANAVGARSGILVRGADADNVRVQQGLEVLGVAGVLEDHFEIENDAVYGNRDSEGLSGDPVRQQAYCTQSNLGEPKAGVFEFNFGADGLIVEDTDLDGVSDTVDNCPQHYNPLQHDQDSDTDFRLEGDACDDDQDGDDRVNLQDNCPRHPNEEQEDLDDDGVGDICDADRDGDRVFNVFDNCPDLKNRYQWDYDDDGIGARCDDEGDAPIAVMLLGTENIGVAEWKYWHTKSSDEIKASSWVQTLIYGIEDKFGVEYWEVEWIVEGLILEWVKETKADFDEFLKERLEAAKYHQFKNSQ